jgi:hypothetical protein
MTKTQTGRITFNARPKTVSSVDAVMTRTGLSKTEVLNRAAQLYDYLSGLAGEGELVLSSPELESPVMLMFL